MPYQIHTIDLNHQGVPFTIAAFLVVGDQPEELMLIETGPESAKEALIEGLADLGVTPEMIKHVLLTHIHFDHAGAAGWWAQQGAHIYVHTVGARHMIDPSKLISSATRIYGDQMDKLWGQLLPVPADQLTELHDGDQIEVGSLRVRCVDTPGHANHHMTFVMDDVAFTGDVAGVSIPGSPILDLPAPPPEISVEKWIASIERLEALELKAVYPTHFGRAENVATRFAELKTIITDAAEMIASWMKAGLSTEAIHERYVSWHRSRLEAYGLSPAIIHQYLTANPPGMSVAGLMRYWRKRWERESASETPKNQ